MKLAEPVLCSTCKAEINPDVCVCGGPPDGHDTGPPWQEGRPFHAFQPDGCRCTDEDRLRKRFWRVTPFDPDDLKEHWRFSVERVDKENTCIAEERCRTRAVDASVADVHAQLLLTEATVRWLHKTLGALILEMDNTAQDEKWGPCTECAQPLSAHRLVEKDGQLVPQGPCDYFKHGKGSP